MENSAKELSSKSSSSPQLVNAPSPAELRFGGGWKLLVPFALLPLFIVAVAVGVFFLFGMMADRDLDPGNYLDKMKTASPHQRWQAAYELSRFLAAGNGGKNKHAMEMEMLDFLKTSPADETLMRKYLIVGLGQIGTESSVPTLMELVSNDKETEIQIYAIWALGRIGSPKAADLLEQKTHSDDSGIRKTAAFSLGFVGNKKHILRLTTLLEDDVSDVRWNTALGLAELGSDAGKQELLFMLDENKVRSATPNLRDAERTQLMLSAVNAAARLKLSLAREPLEKILGSKLDMALKTASRNALNATQQPLTLGKQSE